MPLVPDIVDGNRYAVILAGGDAIRLRGLTRRITGRPTPKQFCPVVGGSTLLEQTMRRVALEFSPKRTIVVLTRHHRDLYADQVKLPDAQLVIQPENRGTGSAILYAVLRIAKHDPDATVTVFPSDHYVDDERTFMSQARHSAHMAGLEYARLVLLGIRPDRTESGYGWIEPAAPFDGCKLFRVARFWEKPPKTMADKLWRQGCLWNSFVLSGTPRCFVKMANRAALSVRQALSSAWHELGTSEEAHVIERIYANLPDCDFSRDILVPNARSLAVLPVQGVYWNDLGDPQRVYETLARTQIRPEWITRGTTRSRNSLIRWQLRRITLVRGNARTRPH